MNVRKFIAPTVGEALAEVRKELGEEAVILRTRTIKDKTKLPFMGKDQVEVMAAIPDRNQPDPSVGSERVAQFMQRLDHRPDPLAVSDLKEEIQEIKGHVLKIAEHVKQDRVSKLPTLLARSYKTMLDQGTEPRYAIELAETVGSHKEIVDDQAAVARALEDLIGSRLRIRRPALKRKGGARVIAIIGPTGVGKTTTLAKLVTSYRHWGGYDTALVSADTYRVAALEQIKTFASIAGLPMEAVYNPQAMPTAMARHKQRDAIFLDTPGRSQSDTQKLDELAAFLDAAEADERLLCLAVNTRIEDQLDIINRYGRLNPTGIIFTKIDDSRHPGGILSVAVNTDIPIAFVTCGQNVPDDIVAADGHLIAEILIDSGVLPKLQKNHFDAWIKADERRVGGAANG